MGAKELGDKQRRTEMARRLLVFRDDWKGLLAELITHQFTRENSEQLRKVLDTTNNPLKRIVRETSTIYTREPVWSFADGVDGEQFRDVLDKGNWASKMQDVNEYVNVCNACLVQVVPCEGTLRFDIITPDELKVWQDKHDPTRAIAYAYRQSMIDTSRTLERWHFWSRDPAGPAHRVLDADGNDISKEFGVDGINPYVDEDGVPILPGVIYLRRWPTSTIWDTTSGNDLYQGTLTIASLETQINHFFRTDAIQQKWASGRVEAAGNQQGGTGAMLEIRSPDGTPVNVGQFNSQSDWVGLRQVINDKLSSLLANYGLTRVELTGDVTSGFSLRVRKEGLMELRRRQLPIYERSDLEMYGVVAAVWNYALTHDSDDYAIEGDMIEWPSEAQPEIDYAPVNVELTVQEQQIKLALDRERVAMSLETPISLIQHDKPNLSNDEAVALVNDNKRVNSELGVTSGGESGAALQAALDIKKQQMALGIRSVVDLFIEQFPDKTPEESQRIIAQNAALNKALIPQAVLDAAAGIQGGATAQQSQQPAIVGAGGELRALVAARLADRKKAKEAEPKTNGETQ